MGDVREIKVNTHGLGRDGKIKAVLHQLTFWGITIGALYVSERLIGGSWVTDIIALMLAFFWLVTMTKYMTGSVVRLTKPEVKAWVDAGMPDDVKAWKAGANHE